MGYTAGSDQLERIAALVLEERPQWDAGLVRVILHAHAHQVDGTDLAIAALRLAKNHDIHTPKAIGWRGPHWQGLDTRPDTAQPLKRCRTCGKTEERCAFERPGPRTGPNADDHEFEAKP